MIKIWLLQMRDLIVRNYFVSIYACIFNKEIYWINKYKVCYLLKLCPFGFLQMLFALFKIQLIYKVDNIYNITTQKHTHIMPIILNFNVCDIDDNNNIIYNKDLISDVKYYNGLIPLEFLLLNTNEQNCNQLQIKYFHKGKIIEKKLNIDNHKNKLIYELFE